MGCVDGTPAGLGGLDELERVSAVMRRFIDAHTDWLTVVRLPAYAPDLNPVEGVWAHVKRDLGNLAACGVDQLAITVKTRLKRIQYRP